MTAEELDPATQAFRRDVVEGLSASPKRIPSQYFYDAIGDDLFQQIMSSEDYYVTRAEEEILREQTVAVLESIANGHQRFALFELGAGDGTKTKHLLRSALDQGRDPVYRPIDISQNVLDQLGDALRRELPDLRFEAAQGEYFSAIEKHFTMHAEPKVILFLGSNIGNLPREKAIALLKAIADRLGPNDRLLVGFDRKKDPSIILKAYNDSEGLTRKFNLNLLRRMNRELGTDFDPSRFVHAPTYCPLTGRALSYLVSTEDQEVHIPGSNGPVRFRAWEAIHTEISQKYDRPMIMDLAHHAGLRITDTFTDGKGYFSDIVFAIEQH